MLMASILENEKQFHIKTSDGDVGKYVILTGDPGRVSDIAEYLDNAEHISTNREYVIYTGTLNGEKVSVVSTGIGGPSAAIAVEELIKCGSNTFIRVGTSGGIELEVRGGDLVISTAAVRDEGTSFEYIPASYPAVANFEVVSALKSSAMKILEGQDKNYHIGVIQSKDSFYGETNPETMPISEKLIDRWESHIRCGCLASEMECAAIFSVAITRKVRAGAVITAIWNVERHKAGLDDKTDLDSTNAIKCAVEAIRILIEKDRV